MKQIYSNATVMWTEVEIARRDGLISEIPAILAETWTVLNPAVRFVRVETPTLTPAETLAGHLEAKFDLLEIYAEHIKGFSAESGRKEVYLRPETTAGTIEALYAIYPQRSQRQKRLPLCLWQAGKSFRDEKHGDTMRATKLRLREFWQLEFELFTPSNSRAPYLKTALDALTTRYGGAAVECNVLELPHYSRRTVDWEIDGLEVAGCSERTDWPDGDLFEVSIGLDRLVALQV